MTGTPEFVSYSGLAACVLLCRTLYKVWTQTGQSTGGVLLLGDFSAYHIRPR